MEETGRSITKDEKMREVVRLCRKVADDFTEYTFEDYSTDEFENEIAELNEATKFIRELRRAMRKLEKEAGIRS